MTPEKRLACAYLNLVNEHNALKQENADLRKAIRTTWQAHKQMQEQRDEARKKLALLTKKGK